jgi:hypothetical protein
VVEVAMAAVLVPLATATWVALLSAELGHLAIWAALGGGLVALVALAWWAYRSGNGLYWRTISGLRDPGWVALLLVGIAVWRLQPAASPWPAYLDSAWYLNAGARIAREGRLSFEPEALVTAGPARHVLVSTLADGQAAGLAGFPADPSRGFHVVAFAVPDVTRPAVVPYHPPFFASWIAIWARLAGTTGAGSAILPWAAAYLLAAAALASAAFGPVAGLLALAIVAVGPAFVYYGATPYAELAGGALALAGLWALVRLAGRPPRPLLAAIAGLGLGLAVLAKADLVLVLGIGWLWWLVARRRVGGWTEGMGLLVGSLGPLIQAAALGLTVSRFYVTLNGIGVLSLLTTHRLAVGVAVPIAVVVAALWWLGARSGRVWWHTRQRRFIEIGLVLAVGLGLLIDALAGEAAPPGMLTILAWLMTPLGLWAAVAGMVLALESEDDAPGPLLLVALLLTPLLVVAPAVTRTISPLYAARRLVPVILPVMSALAASVVVAAWRRGPRAAAWFAGGGTLLVLMALWSAARPLADWREFSGGATIGQRLAAYGGARDVLLFPSTLDGSDAGRMAASLWARDDRLTAVLATPQVDGAVLDRLIASWRGSGRRVFYITDQAPSDLPALPGYDYSELGQESLLTHVLAPVPQLPARSAVRELGFTVYEVVPGQAVPSRQ